MDLGNLIKDVKPEESFGGALPTGMYNVRVEKVEGVQTKAGGKALKVMLRIFGEKFNNACLFDFINIEHPTSKQAADIGKARVAKIASIIDSTDTDSWLGKELTVFAKKEVSEEYGESNRIGAYNPFIVDNTPVVNNATASITSDDIPF